MMYYLFELYFFFFLTDQYQYLSCSSKYEVFQDQEFFCRKSFLYFIKVFSSVFFLKVLIQSMNQLHLTNLLRIIFFTVIIHFSSLKYLAFSYIPYSFLIIVSIHLILKRFNLIFFSCLTSFLLIKVRYDKFQNQQIQIYYSKKVLMVKVFNNQA